jgi:hypothetical protein
MGLADVAMRRVHRRRQTRFAWCAGALAAASVAAVVGGGMLPGGQPDGNRTSGDTAGNPVPGDATGSQPATGPAVGGRGPLPDGSAASCVEQYSPAAVTGRAFAFDGTVSEIGPGRSDRPGAGLGLVGVTFVVNEWFEGGSEATVTVDMPAPDAGGESSPAETPTNAYDVGTRLLVSGEPRWGGPPLTDAIAWGCGFTRYHDEDTAGAWRSAFN